ncbi:OmpA family protein [Haliea sp. E1-2-M8]|uniref:OmpA family protein n=1 Tax=Haliea sp. E1-2-M8 TaxID=3064706 RepID=UPI00271DD625|nr:OmpA family protein [Haliea sp. E1-2-M8]MDO8862187.1 OmpA family protein [Haliea sp. E1-2-M8]
MKQRILAGVAAAAAAASLISTPASSEVPLTINAGIAHWYFDGDRRLEDTDTPWLGLEYAFTDNWAAEILYAEDDSRYSDGTRTDVATWQLGMLYYGGSYIGETMRVRPYLAFGMGEIDIDAGAFDTVETTANAGAGMRWMLTPRFGARLEARMLHSLDENENDFLFSAGLNYYFGDVSAPVVAAAEPAAPVDSDGDGVTDDRDKCPGTAPGTRVDADGCPLPVAQVASIKLKVNFDFDSTVVKEHYFADIGELATFLKRFDDLQVDVEGHTDSVGPENYNQQLSQRRAQAVIDLLVNQHGIAANRLEAVGYGEARPVASNDTDAGRAENRRVMATLEVEYKE